MNAEWLRRILGHLPLPGPWLGAAPAVNAPSPMASRAELDAYIAKLESESRSVRRRNLLLAGGLAAGLVLVILVGWWLYQSNVRAYAVLENVVVARHPVSQGRLEIAFRVAAPGKVYYRRTSGKIATEVIDYFARAGDVKRAWSWVYEPGKDIEVEMVYRGGWWRKTQTARFPTARSADIVIIIDTTGSMSRSIQVLKEKCVAFSHQLTRQSLEHRFALVGFGDTHEADWLDLHPFTGDAAAFARSVSRLKRYNGGDLPESALDALEAALDLPFQPGAIRRFYLVTDARFHDPARSGATATSLAARLEKEQVLLNVFSRAEYAADYKPLLGSAGKFQEIPDFGQVLEEGRILED